MVNKIGFLRGVGYFFSVITIIIGITSLLTAQSPYIESVGIAIIIVGFIAIWFFRKSSRVASKQKNLR
jgi:hypothetical protein